ncbi:MAG: hypothetical protein M3290_07260 [Actinomycetota bacterium]|nr:hypothetical protein [Actinomycetota bacterium]
MPVPPLNDVAGPLVSDLTGLGGRGTAHTGGFGYSCRFRQDIAMRQRTKSQELTNEGGTVKRRISTALLISLLAGAAMLPAGHASAAAAKTIVKDPAGDANFVNDQGTGDGSFGDQTAASVGTVSDLESVTLSNDAKNLYVTFSTAAAPPATTAVGYRVRFNGAPASQCLFIDAYFPGANNDLTEFKAQLKDTCGAGPAGGTTTELKIVGQTVTVPRKLDKAFAKGAKLTAPQALSFQYSGSYPNGVSAPVIDTTKVGTDYTFSN